MIAALAVAAVALALWALIGFVFEWTDEDVLDETTEELAA